MVDNKPARRKGVLVDDMKGLFTDSQYSDFTVRCGSRSWKVHRAIICKRSEYFRTACAGPFKESSEARIDFVDDSPEIINAVLRFLYTDDYEAGNDDADDSDSSDGSLKPYEHDLSFHVEVYAAADKYQLKILAKLALTKFVRHAEDMWHSPEFAEAVQMVYTTDMTYKRALQMSIVEIIRRRAKYVFTANSGEELRKVIGIVPELGLELCMSMVPEPPKVVPKAIPVGWYTCCNASECGKLMEFGTSKVDPKTKYVCRRCGQSSNGQALINKRNSAVLMLDEMHARYGS